MSEIDHKKALDNYYPLIEQCRRIKDYYLGRGEFKGNGPKICSDIVGEMVNILNKADKTYGIKSDA